MMKKSPDIPVLAVPGSLPGRVFHQCLYPTFPARHLNPEILEMGVSPSDPESSWITDIVRIKEPSKCKLLGDDSSHNPAGITFRITWWTVELFIKCSQYRTNPQDPEILSRRTSPGVQQGKPQRKETECKWGLAKLWNHGSKSPLDWENWQLYLDLYRAPRNINILDKQAKVQRPQSSTPGQRWWSCSVIPFLLKECFNRK